MRSRFIWRCRDKLSNAPLNCTGFRGDLYVSIDKNAPLEAHFFGVDKRNLPSAMACMRFDRAPKSASTSQPCFSPEENSGSLEGSSPGGVLKSNTKRHESFTNHIGCSLAAGSMRFTAHVRVRQRRGFCSHNAVHPSEVRVPSEGPKNTNP